MAKKPLPSPEVLRQLLRYEPETGKLFWKERGPEWFKNKKRANSWNARFSGKKAGGSDFCDGYEQITIKALGVCIKSHRAVWAVHYCRHPHEEIDHINGDKKDNRIANLKEATRTENTRNCKRSKKNTSGHTGVSFHKRNKSYCAKIGANGKSVHLGEFRCITAAILARKSAERRYGYSESHGKR